MMKVIYSIAMHMYKSHTPLANASESEHFPVQPFSPSIL